MTRFFYYILIIPLSWIPFGGLYLISDFLFFLLYRVFGYRKEVVTANIRNSFPEKTDGERKAIVRKFYRHLCDLIVESLKVFTISRKEVNERMVFNHVEVANRYFDQGRSIIIVGGHYNNWELFAVGIAEAMKHKAIALYYPITNAFIDAKMKETRSKYGLMMVPTKQTKELFLRETRQGTKSAFIFGADQSPSNEYKCHWMTFLNQDTGVLFGVEKYAKENDMPVVFGRINKLSRGHYSFDFIDVTGDPRPTAKGEITEKFTRMLEEDIRREPAYWLWTHKRWKKKRPAPGIVAPSSDLNS